MSATRTSPSARPFAATLRRMMMIVAYFAILFAIVTPMVRSPGQDRALAVARAAMLLSPWLLACLIAVFEAPGPLRSWAVLCAMFLFYPAIALFADATFVASAWQGGGTERAWSLLAFNALVGGSSWIFFRRMWPLSCPKCQRKTSIPLVRLGGLSTRLTRTHWCGSCGSLHWRDPAGVWHDEKRHTWLGDSRAGVES